MTITLIIVVCIHLRENHMWQPPRLSAHLRSPQSCCPISENSIIVIICIVISVIFFVFKYILMIMIV